MSECDHQCDSSANFNYDERVSADVADMVMNRNLLVNAGMRDPASLPGVRIASSCDTACPDLGSSLARPVGLARADLSHTGANLGHFMASTDGSPGQVQTQRTGWTDPSFLKSARQ